MKKMIERRLGSIAVGVIIGILLACFLALANPFLLSVMLHEYCYLRYKGSDRPSTIEKYAILSYRQNPNLFVGKLDQENNIDKLHLKNAFTAITEDRIVLVTSSRLASKACRLLPSEEVDRIIDNIPIEARTAMVSLVSGKVSDHLHAVIELRAKTEAELKALLKNSSSQENAILSEP